MIKDAFGAGPLPEFVSDLPARVFVNVCVDGAAHLSYVLVPSLANFALFFGLAVQAYEQTLSTQPAQQPIRAMKRAFKESVVTSVTTKMVEVMPSPATWVIVHSCDRRCTARCGSRSYRS